MPCVIPVVFMVLVAWSLLLGRAKFGRYIYAIGGTSLFGGRGHPLHAVLGDVVIAAIVNGMALLGLPAAIQLMATALVLLASITVDVVVRRRGETSH